MSELLESTALSALGSRMIERIQLSSHLGPSQWQTQHCNQGRIPEARRSPISPTAGHECPYLTF